MQELSDLHPLDTRRDLVLQQQEEQQRIAAQIERKEDLAFLLRGPVGRREVRRQLWVSGFDVLEERVPTVFDRHASEMARREAERAPGLQLIWTLMRMLAQRELPFEHFEKLMTETMPDE